jgi:hypothetical protein
MAKISLTESQLITLIKSVLREQNEPSEEWEAVQEALNKFLKKNDIEMVVPVDGRRSPQTDEALLLFQNRIGIKDSDAMGRETMIALRDLGYLPKSKFEKVIIDFGL